MRPTTANDVAAFMVQRLAAEEMLYQDVVVSEIVDAFGEGFVYINRNGNLAISKAVLAEFRKLTEGTVVWSKSERFWRYRESFDQPGKRRTDF